ncbi:MAG: hypothetical protein WA988_02390 [Candidatus Nanopelagicales bacterium]
MTDEGVTGDGTDEGVTDEGVQRRSFSITKRDLIVAAITALVVVVIGGIVFGIVGRGGDDDPKAASPTTSARAAVTSAAPQATTAASTADPNIHGVGVPVTKGGVTLTVNEVTRPASIPATRGPGRTPQSGGKYVRLDTTIKNDGQKSMDLTCSFDVQVVLVDRQRRQFDHVDDQYEIAGNPGCNDGLQPGFSIGMTYVFEVPESADITFFGFGDPSTDAGYNDLTWISLPPA